MLLRALTFIPTMGILVHGNLGSQCPFFRQNGFSKVTNANRELSAEQQYFDYAVEFQKLGDLSEVRKDLRTIFTSSNDEFWPADYGTYAPLMIRLAWHAAGSYRISDGRGGADGARQRFWPENSWPDNANLDKARKLLFPMKEKYGKSLSWADLFVLAGDEAMESMGFKTLGFCGGRLDERDGRESLLLGMTRESMEHPEFGCGEEDDGNCGYPLGQTTMGLIYVNPEGHKGIPNPSQSAPDIRSTFGNMGMNDTETVSLIAGGHAFGKTHGSCTNSSGPSPQEVLNRIERGEIGMKKYLEEKISSMSKGNAGNMEGGIIGWEGGCGNGKGEHTVTSGFEGAWTSNPTRWDSEYLHNLLNYNWQKKKGPGGHWQWEISSGNGPGPQAPDAHLKGVTKPIMMLTSDIALTIDNSYKKIIKEFADDKEKFEKTFAHSWYKLMTRDMGPISRCLGPDVPPIQLFQDPLPLRNPNDNKIPSFPSIRNDILQLLSSSLFSSSTVTHGELFRLAINCASTFRFTDYRGGCNGSRIRLLPQKEWISNLGIEQTLKKLEPVYEKYRGDGLSWADLIVFSGTVALEDAGQSTWESLNIDHYPSNSKYQINFCPGRVDALQEQTEIASFDVLDKINAIQSFPISASESSGSSASSSDSSSSDDDVLTIRSVKESAYLMGLTDRELVSLVGAARSLGGVHPYARRYLFTSDHNILSNDFFTNLLLNQIVVAESSNTNSGTSNSNTPSSTVTTAYSKMDLFFQSDFQLTALSENYAGSNQLFLNDVSKSYEKLMNQDRFDGPTRNECYNNNGSGLYHHRSGNFGKGNSNGGGKSGAEL